MSKTLAVDEKMYKFQIWDTAGQEKVKYRLQVMRGGGGGCWYNVYVSRHTCRPTVYMGINLLRSIGSTHHVGLSVYMYKTFRENIPHIHKSLGP